MSEIDWTRVYEDAVGGIPEPCQPIGCDNDIHLPGCEVAKLVTESCPPWQEAVLETLPNFVELIHQAAAELRKSYRMRPNDVVTVVMPRWRERELTEIDRALILEGHVYVDWVDDWSETTWRG